MRRVADGCHNGVALDHAPVGKLDLARGHRRDPRVQDDVQPPRAQIFLRVIAQLRADLRQQVGGAVDEDHAKIRLCDARVKAVDGTQQIEDLPRRLDPRKSAADHDKREQPLPRRFVVLQIRLLDPVDEHAAQLHRVANRFQQQRVFRHARHAAQIDDAPECEHEMLKFDLRVWCESARFQGEPARVQIDRGDSAAQHRHPLAKQPDRIYDVPRRDRRADDLREHRLENHVVAIRDQRHPRRSLVPQFARQRLRAIHAREPAARDHDIEFQFRPSHDGSVGAAPWESSI